MFKKFTKYFGGEYMKYWYVAFGIVVICLSLSMLNDSSVKEYELTIYGANGEILEESLVDKMFIARELDNLPASKLFIPIKKI